MWGDNRKSIRAARNPCAALGVTGIAKLDGQKEVGIWVIKKSGKPYPEELYT
jgi:hypothetical protein